MHLVAITIDYETWQPVPPGKQIDWHKDVFDPANKLLDLADEHQVKLTIFAEMGEYFWLQHNQLRLAQKMEAQWQDAIRRGHDIQLHLHPNWLPELGAKHKNGEWDWDEARAGANDYPGDLAELIQRCKMALESILKPVKSDYQVTSFRAGGYRAQPFDRLYQALTSNGIFCDSSVYAGGISAERGYNYLYACSNYQPYFAAPHDPQKCVASNSDVLEIPIFTYAPAQRWFLDGYQSIDLANRLLTYFAIRNRHGCGQHLQATCYRRWPYLQHLLNRLPSTTIFYYVDQPWFLGLENDYFVMIGHTKADLNWEAIAANWQRLQEDGRFSFVTLSEMAWIARQELLAQKAAPSQIQKNKVLRALNDMAWVYRKLNPERCHESLIPEKILQGGFAWCHGYSLVLQHILEQQGYKTRQVAIWMKPHPRGHGSQQIDSHSLLEIWIDEHWQLFDPTCNVYFDGYSLSHLVSNPALADLIFEKHIPDARFCQRHYELYCTRQAFELCFHIEYENRSLSIIKAGLKQIPGIRQIAGFWRGLSRQNRSQNPT